jgi:hypothetical protein
MKCSVANVLPVFEISAIVFIVEHATGASMRGAMIEPESEGGHPIVRNLRTHS